MDPSDDTECLVLDGNRTGQDILCRGELEAMTHDNLRDLRLLFYLSCPAEAGPRRRLGKSVFASEIGSPRSSAAGDELVLICGPGPMERSSKESLLGMGREYDCFDLILVFAGGFSSGKMVGQMVMVNGIQVRYSSSTARRVLTAYGLLPVYA